MSKDYVNPGTFSLCVCMCVCVCVYMCEVIIKSAVWPVRAVILLSYTVTHWDFHNQAYIPSLTP